MKRVVIVGGGFGGVYTARCLLRLINRRSDIEVVLINKQNYFLFSPMLHEVATGGLNRHNIVQPIREILKQKNFRFMRCEVASIDAKKKIVHAVTGDIAYDVLVIAIGAQSNFYDVPGASGYAFPLKSLEDAVQIRNHVIDSLELAAKLHDRQDVKPCLTFVVVGGGPTGVELAGELAEFVTQAIKVDYPELRNKKTNIILLQRDKEIIPFIHECCRKDAARVLERKGVIIMTDSEVVEVEKNIVVVKHGKRIPTRNVFWTAGVKPRQLSTIPQLQNERGFFEVDRYMRVKQAEEIYALGDCALFFNENESKPVPALAQVATKQAKVLAHNIMHAINGEPLEKFRFQSSGLLVSVGRRFGVADLRGGIHFKGFFAWWLWRTVYLFKLVGFANKLKVAYEWTLNLFFPRDTTQI